MNLLVGLAFIFAASNAKAQQETAIKVTGIRSAKGKIMLDVFKDNTGYNDQKPYKTISFDKKALIDGNTLTVSVKLEPGIYGFTIVDDENENGKIDKNFIGMPKEGFGFSNFFMEKMKKPTFDEFKVDLTSPHKINIRVKYM